MCDRDAAPFKNRESGGGPGGKGLRQYLWVSTICPLVGIQLTYLPKPGGDYSGISDIFRLSHFRIARVQRRIATLQFECIGELISDTHFKRIQSTTPYCIH